MGPFKQELLHGQGDPLIISAGLGDFWTTSYGTLEGFEQKATQATHLTKSTSQSCPSHPGFLSRAWRASSLPRSCERQVASPH